MTGGTGMPFSSLADPVDIARAHAALDRAWAEIQRAGLILGSEESERSRLAVIISGLAPRAIDEADLVTRAVERFAAPKPKG